MKYRVLADTGVFVSELCLGAMTFGGRGQMWEMIGGMRAGCRRRDGGPGSRRRDQLHRHRGRLRRRVSPRRWSGKRSGDAGARSCSRPRSGAGWEKGPNQVGLSRLHIIEAAEASLRRLGTDWIDIYQIHRSDPLTCIEETLRALDDLVREGKVRYIGCSNLMAWQLMQALGISRREGLERFKCTQSYYSLVGRELEREMIPLLEDQGVGLLVWSPLAGGLLTGKFGPGEGGGRGGEACQLRLPAGGPG